MKTATAPMPPTAHALPGGRLRRVWPAAVALVATAAVVTGCTATAAEPTNLPEKNIAEWVTPLDQYIPQNASNANYAEQLLVGKCIEKAGLSWAVPWRDIHADNGPSWNSVERRLFNSDLAAKYGYHNGPAVDESLPAWQAFVASKQSMSSAEEAAIGKCVPEARKTLPLLSPTAAQKALDLIQVSYDAAFQDDDVVAAASKWRTCMEPQGIADLPDSPRKMPSDSLVSRFSLDLGDRVGTTSVDPKEVAIATADAACRDSSGFAKALYDAEWDRDVAALRDNADELARAEKEIKANETAVLDVISSNAPAK